MDFSKYNAYIDVSDVAYEMEVMLAAYFTVVENQPEFALVEGIDYSMLDDAFSFYSLDSYAMNYLDADPAYPEQDALLEVLNEPYLAVGEVIDNYNRNIVG